MISSLQSIFDHFFSMCMWVGAFAWIMTLYSKPNDFDGVAHTVLFNAVEEYFHAGLTMTIIVHFFIAYIAIL